MPDIIVKNLAKAYGRGQAVRDVSLTIKDGSFTCILGPSGCGKTTFLRLIAGLEAADGGRISIDGRVVDDPVRGLFVPPDQRGVGLVFQSYALWPHMTVAQNVEFGLSLQRLNPADRRKRRDEMLGSLRITDLADRYPAQLSGGQQQRVALARTMALAPKVLLLDEPLSNLDAALRLAMRAELARLHREFGTTIVFVTHDQWEAMTLSTEMAVMADGRVQQMGKASDVYECPTSRFVAEFIGNPPINVFPAGSQVAMALIPREMAGRDGITVGLRPEAIRIAAAAPSPFALAATVTTVIPTGGSWIIELALQMGGAPVLHACHLRSPHAPGETVYITAQSAGVHFFAPDGRCLPAAAQPTEETA